MIELKITNSAAVLLLTERMKTELELRKKYSMLPDWSSLNSLPYRSLVKIAETSAFDLICLLPADIITEKNNLDSILTKAIRSLAPIYNKEDFTIYPINRARRIIKRLTSLFDKANLNNNFQYN